MRTLCIVVCLVAVGLFATSSASGLEIRVAPRTLVLSSDGGTLTVHTDVPGLNHEVTLVVDGTGIPVWTKTDSCGNLVVKCSKDAVTIQPFDGKTTTVTVTLTVVDFGSAEEDITVRK